MANGTIAFDTLQTSGQITGTAKSVDTDYVVNGVPKYFGVWDNNSDTTLRDSFNITSASDNATGDFTVTFTNTMSNEFYSALGNTSGENNQYGPCSSQDTHSTTGCGYQARKTGTTTDFNKNSFAGVGDLA
tara:strand:- start:59 stop:451 length:393 start_codon:yes stop_codon:yes gene_type:complete